MRKPKPQDQLTTREEELMRLLWEHGPLPVAELVKLYPEPQPHVNTVATVVRRLEAKGFATHTSCKGDFTYHALKRVEDFRSRSLGEIVKNYFHGSYLSAVSALVSDEKISADELRELLAMVEKKD